MRKRKPKFNIGDTVMETVTEEQFVVGIRLFDPSDGWEYGPENVTNKRLITLHFEENLELVCGGSHDPHPAT